MRPISLIVLLLVLAVALAGGLLLLGRGTDQPAAEVAGASVSDASGSSQKLAAAPDLDATGAEATEAGRAAPALAPDRPGPGAGSAVSKPSGVAVRGRVVGNLGRPVGGAVVLAAEASGFSDLALDEIDPVRMPWMRRAETLTDADGRFEIRPEVRANVAIAVRANGFAPLDREFALSGAERDVGELALDPSVVLSGRVVDAGGRPIDGVAISRLSSSGSAPAFGPFGRTRGAVVARTDSQGLFRVDQLSAGPWRLLLAHEAHPDQVETGETDRPGTVRSGLTFTMEAGDEIQGRVVDAPADVVPKLSIRAVLQPGGEDGTPAEGPVRGATSVREARCSPDGTFTVRGLKPGRSYRLSARDTDRQLFAFSRARSSPVTARAGDHGVEIPYRPETALVFQVVDAANGEPLVDLSVRAGFGFMMPLLDEDGQPMRRFAEGRVRFGNLPGRPGGSASEEALTLVVEAAGYRALEQADIKLVEGQDNDLGVLRLERAPVVAVQVLDDSTGEPVEGARVEIREDGSSGGSDRFQRRLSSLRIRDDEGDDAFSPGASQRARTGSDGRASVTSLPGRTVRLHVRHGSHAPHASDPFVLPAAESVERTVRLGLGGTVVVEVVDSHDSPISGAEIDHQGPGADRDELVVSSHDGRTDAEGRLVFEHLEAGAHRFRLRSSASGGVASFGGGGLERRVMRRGGGEESQEGWSSVEVGERTAETLRLVAPARGSLAGAVSEGGQPLANAELRLVRSGEESQPMPFFGGGRESRTDGRGEYLFDGVEEGEYHVEVTHSSRAMAFQAPARIREGENRLDLDLAVAIVAGTVKGADGQPIAGVRVRAERAPAKGEPERRSFALAVMVRDEGEGPEVMTGPAGGGKPAFTDEKGRYSLRGVLSDVELVVHASGQDVQPGRSEPFRVDADGIKKNVDLSLEKGGSIEISVQRPGGRPAGRFLARATPVEGGEPKVQMVGPGGSTKITGLKPGRWRVVLDPLMGPVEGDTEGELLEKEVEVVLGAPAKASFEAP